MCVGVCKTHSASARIIFHLMNPHMFYCWKNLRLYSWPWADSDIFRMCLKYNICNASELCSSLGRSRFVPEVFQNDMHHNRSQEPEASFDFVVIRWRDEWRKRARIVSHLNIEYWILNWVEFDWIELNWILNWIEYWIELNTELNWILNWIEYWIELNIELNWILNWIEYWIELNIELNWIWNWIEYWIELNWIELYWILNWSWI